MSSMVGLNSKPCNHPWSRNYNTGAFQERRANKAREWPGQAEEFRKWFELGVEGGDDNTVLFCYGDPEVSKTFLR